MLRDSMEYAEADMKSRSLREQQVEAERVLEALDAALAADGDELLSEQERDDIVAARNRLEAAKVVDNPAQIRSVIRMLEQTCEDFVARRMNTSIRKAMKGHAVTEYAHKDEQGD